MSDSNNNKSPSNESRRDFVKKASYAAPAVVTLAAMPSLANAGSARIQPRDNNGGGNGRGRGNGNNGRGRGNGNNGRGRGRGRRGG